MSLKYDSKLSVSDRSPVSGLGGKLRSAAYDWPAALVSSSLVSEENFGPAVEAGSSLP